MKPKPKENFKPIWKYYVAINKTNARCKFCNEMYSWRGRSNTQLRSHLEKRHPSQFTDFVNLEKAAQVLSEAQKVQHRDDTNEASSNTATRMEGPPSMTTPTAVSRGQHEILAVYMEEDIYFASGHMAKVKGTEFIKQWENLAATLNTLRDGAYKSSDEWRDYWTKTKVAVEKKMKENQKRKPAETEEWNSFETKVMKILHKTSSLGYDAVQGCPKTFKYLRQETPTRKEAPPTRVTDVPDTARATFGMDEDRNPALERIAVAVERIVNYMETNERTLLQIRELLRK